MARKARTYGNADEPRTKRIDPIVEGLFNRLPVTGSEWPLKERHEWLNMLEQAFRVIYEEAADDRPPATPATSPTSTRHPTSGA